MKRLYFLLSTLGLVLVLTSSQALAQGFSSPIWQASYWNNTSLSGPPVLQRHENSIDYNWGTGSPGPDVNDDDFSARWVGYIDFSLATYRFAATSDDGIRVWVDGDLIIDKWYDHPVQTFTGDKSLGAGRHQIVVEYYEAKSGAIIRLWWAPAPPPDGHNWRGEYYNNTSLSGEPVLVREDPAIGFNWADVSPGPGVNADKFSVRWTQSIYFQPGSYRFEMTVDDGARLWVNGRRLIDAWQVQSPRTYTAEIYLPGGYTPVKMEYFDNLLGAVAHLSWSPAPARTDFWRAEYYRGTTLNGAPVLVRSEADINYNWGESSPAPALLGVDRFSARWQRTLNLPAGTYHFNMTVDDGGRLWLDGRLLIDAWQVQSPRTYTADVYLPGQSVTVRMEYFENTGGAVARLRWSGSEPVAKAALNSPTG